MKGETIMETTIQRKHSHADLMSFHKEVTGSCTLAVIKFEDGLTIRGIVDFGSYQEKEYAELNQKLFFKPEELDFVLITHNHIDHTGRLPFLMKNGYNGNIFMTKVTQNLIPLAFEDSYKVLKGVAKRNNENVLYSQEDIKAALDCIIGCQFEKEYTVYPGVVKATFFKNGHLPGAAMILLQIEREGYEQINILFTGDYNNKNMFFTINSLPEEVKNLPLTIVQESTYGDMDSSKIIECFEENVLDAIRQHKTVLIPVFSLGRAQEILSILKQWQKQRKLGKNVPIYLDGKLAIKYTKLYLKGAINIKPSMNNFLPDHLQYVDSKELRAKLLDENDKYPKIILSTSGMGTYGPSQTYIPRFLSREDVLIHFTGYTGEDTMGYKIRTAEVGDIVEVGGMIVEKKADVQHTAEFSAHAKADEMIEFLNQFTDLKLVLVQHGESKTKKIFANRILKEVKTKEIGILGDGFLFRIGKYGLLKPISLTLQ